MDERKIDFLGPEFIMAVVAALMSDFASLFLLALLIPIIGLVIALMVIMFHYCAGFIILFLIFPKLKHLLPKLTFILALILPLPFLTIGLVVAIILQNRLIEAVVTHITIQAIAVATVGAGEVLEVGVVAAKAGAVAAEVAAKAVEAGAAATEAGVAAAKAGTAITEAAGAAAKAGVIAAEAETEAAEAGAGAAEAAEEVGLQLQQPIRGGIPYPQEPAVPKRVPEKTSVPSEDAKLEKRKKAISDYWEKIKGGFEEKEEKKRREKEEKSEEEEGSNGI
jgi:hypothetical protein